MERRVKAADRTLDVFEAFAKEARPLSLSELAKSVDMPVSSCHGLVKTLTSRGYLRQVGTQRNHYPTKLLFDLASRILDHDPVLAKVSHLLEALRDETDETVVLGKRLGDFVIYLDVFESTQTIRFSADVSALRPLYSSALGKAILSQLPDDELDATVRGLDLKPLTRNTLTSARKLLADIREGLERGWQITRGESVADVMAVAAPLRLAGEDYAVAVAGPLQRMEPVIDSHAAVLKRTVERMQAAMV